MHPAAAVLATLVVVAMVVVLPIRGHRRYRALQAAGGDRALRAALMRRSTVTKWALVAVVVVVDVLARSAGWVIWWGPDALVFGGILLVGVVIGGVRLRMVVRSPRRRPKLFRAARPFASLLPITPAERRQFVLVAVTAGVTEEVLYRAFLIAYLHWLWPAGSALVVCVVAGVAFGAVHAYQGWRSVVLLSVLGTILGAVYLVAGLVVVIFVHTLLDLRLLLIPPEMAAELAAAQADSPAPPPPPVPPDGLAAG
jgi:uncharacterized protein